MFQNKKNILLTITLFFFISLAYSGETANELSYSKNPDQKVTGLWHQYIEDENKELVFLGSFEIRGEREEYSVFYQEEKGEQGIIPETVRDIKFEKGNWKFFAKVKQEGELFFDLKKMSSLRYEGYCYKGLGIIDKSVWVKIPEHFLQAIDFENEGKLEVALEGYSKTIGYYPTYAYGYLYRSNLLATQENYQAASTDLKKVIELDAFLAPEAYIALGWYLILQRKINEAQSVCQKAYELNPDDYASLANLGHTYLLSNDEEKAKIYYRKALHIISSNEELNHVLEDFRIFISNKWEIALAEKYLKWTEEKYKNVYSLYKLVDKYWKEGKKYEELGDYKKAAQLYKKSVEIEKKNPEIRYKELSSALLQIAQCYFFEQQYEKALPFSYEARLLATSRNHLGDVFLYTRSLVEIYLAWGKNELAQKFSEQYLEKAKETKKPIYIAIAYGVIGDVFAYKKEHKKAIDKYLLAIKLLRDLENQDQDILLFHDKIMEIYNNLCNYEKAIIYCEKCEKLAQKLELKEKKETYSKLKNEIKSRLREIQSPYFPKEKNSANDKEKNSVDDIAQPIIDAMMESEKKKTLGRQNACYESWKFIKQSKIKRAGELLKPFQSYPNDREIFFQYAHINLLSQDIEKAKIFYLKGLKLISSEKEWSQALERLLLLSKKHPKSKSFQEMIPWLKKQFRENYYIYLEINRLIKQISLAEEEKRNKIHFFNSGKKVLEKILELSFPEDKGKYYRKMGHSYEQFFSAPEKALYCYNQAIYYFKEASNKVKTTKSMEYAQYQNTIAFILKYNLGQPYKAIEYGKRELETLRGLDPQSYLLKVRLIYSGHNKDFRISIKYQEKLDEEVISKKLREELGKNGFIFSKDSELKVVISRQEWKIFDKNNHKNYCTISKESYYKIHPLVIYFYPGLQEEATEFLHKEIDWLGNSRYLAEQAGLYQRLANDYRSGYMGEKNIQKSIQYRKEELSIYEKLGDDSKSFFALSEIAKDYRRTNQLKEALEYYRKQILVCQKNSWGMQEYSVLHDIGNLYRLWGLHDKAKEHFLEVLTAAEARQDGYQSRKALLQLIKLSLREFQYDKIILYQKKILQIAQKSKNKISQVLSHVKLAKSLQLNHKKDEALQHYQNGVQKAEETGRIDLIVDSLSTLARFYDSMGDYVKAMEINHKALLFSGKLANKNKYRHSLSRIASTYKKMGNVDKAVHYYEKSMSLSLKNDILLGQYFDAINEVFYFTGDYQKAIHYYKHKLELMEKKDLSLTAFYYGKMAEISMHWNKYDDALQYLEKTLHIKKQSNDYARELFFIGHCHQQKGNYEQAFLSFHQGLEICNKTGKFYQKTMLYSAIGDAHLSLGKYDNAIRFYKKALQLETQQGESTEGSLSNIAKVYIKWKKPAKALSYYLDTLTRITNTEMSLYCLIDVGNTYELLNNEKKALEHYKRALSISRTLADTSLQAYCYRNIGNVHKKRESYKEAEKCYQLSLEISLGLKNSKEIATAKNSLADLYKTRRNYRRAFELYEECLTLSEDIKQPSTKAYYLNEIGMVCFLSERYEEAIDYYLRSLSVFEKIQENDSVNNLQYNIAQACYHKKSYEKAIEYLKKNILAGEKKLKKSPLHVQIDFFEKSILPSYRLLILTYLEQKDFTSALKIIELSRAQYLETRLTEEKTVVQDIKKLQEKLESDTAVIIYRCLSGSPVIFTVSDKGIYGKEVSTDEINQSLKKYNQYLQKYYEVTSDQILPMLKSQKDLVDIISHYNLILRSEGQVRGIAAKEPLKTSSLQKKGIFHQLSQLLYDLLIQPINEHVQEKSKWIIIPDSALNTLSFASLLDQNQRYLIEKHQVQYIQSLEIWELLKKRPEYSRQKKLLAIGGANYTGQIHEKRNLVFPDDIYSLQIQTEKTFEEGASLRSIYESLGIEKWSPLPETLEEVEEIAKIFPSSKIFIQNQVKEFLLKELSKNKELEDYSVIHFALHGLVIPKIPILSALVFNLSNQNHTNEGYLTLKEIENLDLNAELVNLSACETGLGKIYEGEGVFGFTQAFLIAGARGVCSSLWNINDSATKTFMIEMYQIQKTSKLKYADAITKTQRNFISGKHGKRYQNPKFWAPFVYYGK